MGKLTKRQSVLHFLVINILLSEVMVSIYVTDLHADMLVDLEGRELVSMMLKKERRLEAYFELCRRQNPDKWSDIDEFQSFEFNRIADVLVCPQGDGREPLYLVLNDWFDDEEFDGFQISDADKLFPKKKGYLSRITAPFDFITSKGKFIYPYGKGNIVSDGFIHDINQDGYVELVQEDNYSIDGIGWCKVLVVSVAADKSKKIFAVLYGWNLERDLEAYTDEWWFDVGDRDGDGIYEIEIGPRIADGVEVKAVFSWDSSAGTYVSKEGSKSKYFCILEPYDIWEQIEALSNKAFLFNIKEELKSKKEKKPSRSYHYESLRNLTDEEIIHYMERPESETTMFFEEGETTKLPQNFWNLPAKESAYKLVDLNRGDIHRRTYRLAIDDLAGRKAPETCSVSFDYMANHGQYSTSCYLRCDPAGSYYMYTFSGYHGYISATYSGQYYSHSLGHLALKYDDARQIAHTILWLSRIRSMIEGDKMEGISMFSSADGFSNLRFISVKPEDCFKMRGTTWFTKSIPRCWRDNYTKETYLNFAYYVIETALPEFLKKQYPDYEAGNGSYSEVMDEKDDAVKPKVFRQNAHRVLNLFSGDENKISHEIAEIAAEFAGDKGGKEFVPVLQKALSQLPKPRERGDVEYDLDTLEDSDRLNVDSYINDTAESADDFILSEEDEKEERIGRIRESIVKALEQIEASKDIKKLEQMTREGSHWAAMRLKQMDPKKYLDYLESQLPGKNDSQSQSVFWEIFEISPERARRMATGLGADFSGPLSITVLKLVVSPETSKHLPNEDALVQSVIRTVKDASVSGGFRCRAIEALVPDDNPLRFETEEIDELLLSLLKARTMNESLEDNLKEADDIEGILEGVGAVVTSLDDQFILEATCLALARRGGNKYYEKVVEQLKRLRNTISFQCYDGILSAAVYSSQSCSDEKKSALSNLLQSEFVETCHTPNTLIWAIWAGDFQEMKPQLERISTADPEDIESDDANMSGLIRKPAGRYHLARKVVNIWNEEDNLAKAKLSIAFAFAYDLNNRYRPERFNRVELELSKIREHLSREQRINLLSFVEFCERYPIDKEDFEITTNMKSMRSGLAQVIESIIKKGTD
jgi:hypothetical protein